MKRHGTGKDITNPEVVGPGNWFVIHTMAKRAGESGNPYQAKMAFWNHMKMLSETFPCITCRNHIKEYLDKNPIEPFWRIIDESTGQDVGLFKYTWIFHNIVNVRLGKPEMSWNTAYSMYYDEEESVCSLSCGH